MDPLLTYNGPTVNGDTNNTASAYVKRGADKSIQVGAATINGQLSVAGGRADAGKAISANTTADQTATNFEVNAAGGAVTVTLPPVSSVPGQVYTLVKTDGSANAAQFQGNGTDPVNGTAGGTLGTTTQWGVTRVRANQAGTAWYAN